MPTSKNSTTHSPQTVKKTWTKYLCLISVYSTTFEIVNNPLYIQTLLYIDQAPTVTNVWLQKTSNYTSLHSSWMSQAGKMPCKTSTVLKHTKKEEEKKLRSSQARLWFIIPLVDSLHLHSYYCCYFSYPWASNSLTLKKIVAIFSIFIRFKWDKHCWIFS